MFKAVLIAALLFCGTARSQMVDMRARSMRGRQAYPQGVAVRPQQPVVYSRSAPSVHSREQESGQTAEPNQPKQFRQTGLKIFKEEDEDKVLNISVDNPEFDKLSDSRKQNILSRISYEEK